MMDSRMVKAMENGHPAPWAIFDVNEDLLKRATEDEGLIDVLEKTVLEEIETDSDREIEKVAEIYRASNEDQRMIIDALLVCLCGWSPTLLEKAESLISSEESKEVSYGQSIV